MKKLSFIVMACLLALGLTQCKKNEPANNNNADNGDRVSITLQLTNGGQRVHPEEENGLANIVYDNGDVVYVGSNGKYMGYLTYNGTLFTGSINAEAIEGQPLQFIFMGGQDFHASLTENSTEEYTFNIGDQSNGLAVISGAASNEDFSLTNLSYTAYLRNKCALVKFDLGEVNTDAAITLSGLKTQATIGFDGTVTNGETTGDIVTYGTSATRYAVVLSDQETVTDGTLSAEGYEGTFSIPTAAFTNAFLTDATMTLTATAPTVTTGAATITAASLTTATGHVTLTTAGNMGDVTEIGLCWGTTANPTIANSHAAADGYDVNTEYAVTLADLVVGTDYYVRGYAKVGDTYHYASNSIRINTQYVDLGLPIGLLWATCNVGAETPETFGGYYMWGETEPHANNSYKWSDYKYCHGSGTTLTKYCNKSDYGYNGYTDELTYLESGDDAATANWGGNWRMPTMTEFAELYDNTTHEWTTQNGVNGMLFTATNGNSIFLPAAGVRYSLNYVANLGYYWSNSLLETNLESQGDGTPDLASGLAFYSDGTWDLGCSYRRYGRTVRPVHSAPQN